MLWLVKPEQPEPSFSLLLLKWFRMGVIFFGGNGRHIKGFAVEDFEIDWEKRCGSQAD
jgi:hypothetical protein